jgi:hypothetical protein
MREKCPDLKVFLVRKSFKDSKMELKGCRKECLKAISCRSKSL